MESLINEISLLDSVILMVIFLCMSILGIILSYERKSK